MKNGERYLEEAVQSVLQQTYRDFELCIYNDGSTDRTGELINELSRSDSRVCLKEGPPVGITKALNALAEQVTSPLIARMDADDISHPGRFESQLRYLDQHPECVALGGQIELIDEQGRVTGSCTYPQEHASITCSHLDGVTQMAHPATMIRRDAFEEVGGYNASLRYAQDLDLWIKLAEVGYLANLSDCVLQYRVHRKSISTDKRSEQWMYARMAVEDAWARSGGDHVPKTRLSELYRRHASFETQEGNSDKALELAKRAFRLTPWNPMAWYTLARVMI